MFTPRRARRSRVVLPATVEVEADDLSRETIDARTLDVSPCGVGLIAPEALEVGRRVRVTIEERRGGHRRVRRWVGVVANLIEQDTGHRMGVAFDGAEGGPLVAIGIVRDDGRPALFRLDPPWHEASTEVEGEPAASSERRRSPRWPRVLAALGFLSDQVTKTLAFAPAGGAHRLHEALPGLACGPGVKDFGPPGGPAGWSNLGAGLLGLALTGLVARLARGAEVRSRTIEAAGWGLMLAGLLGNAADRLTLGYARDFLAVRAWPGATFNGADLLAVLGAGLALGAWTAGRPGRTRGRAASAPPVEMAARGSAVGPEPPKRPGAGGSLTSAP